jgi:hypothetical protein
MHKRSPRTNFIMKVLTTAADLANLESDCSKDIILFMKLCLKCVHDLVSISSLVPENFDHHSLIVIHSECDNDDKMNHIVKLDSIRLTCGAVQLIRMSCDESRSPQLTL